MMPLRSCVPHIIAISLGLIVMGCATIAEVPAETFRLAVERAVAYDSGGIPQFAAGEDFILDMANNPGRVVYASTADMVRVSADGPAAIWLRCSDLQEHVGQCAAPGDAAPTATMTRSLPICPGDPRCPRPGKK